MKKFRKNFLLVAICVFVILIGGIFIFNIANSDEYKYASRWSSSVNFTLEDGTPADITEDDNLDRILNECIDMINSMNLRQLYPYFNWDKLENVKIAHCSGIITSDSKFHSNGIDAKYFIKQHLLAILPDAEAYEEDYLKTLILHELIHILTFGTNEFSQPQLYEGIADYLAAQISKAYNLPFRLQYMYEVYFLHMLQNIWGEEETINLLIKGTFDDELDSLTCEGFGKKLSDNLLVIGHYYELYDSDKQFEKLLLVGQDIVVHATANYCSKLTNESERKQILLNCKEMLLIKNDYFLSLLE